MKYRRRPGLSGRLTRAFVLLAGALLLVMGTVLTWVSYENQLEQVRIRQQKTAREAALVTTAYLVRAQEALNTYGQLGSLQGLLLRSMSIQQQELTGIMETYGDVYQGLTLVAANGEELAKVSRYQTFLPEDMGSQSGEIPFETAIQGQSYIADTPHPSLYSTVQLITMAVPIRGRDRDGVLLAEVSINGIWDAMAQVDMGETGYAYIINRRTGELVSHSELARYLTLSRPEGRQALMAVPLVSQLVAGVEELENQYVGLDGDRVVGAAAELPDTDWAMVVELPTSEALAGVRRMLYLIGLLIVVGAVVAGSLGLLVPRRIVRPILALQEGAQAIGAGHLDRAIEVDTGDELEDLAVSFNQMAASLQTSRQELERWGHDLEARVEERTATLASMTERMRQRADQLQIITEVSRAIVSVRDLDQLLPQVTRLISQRFGWYHVGIFLLDEAGSPGSSSQYAVLRAANSEGGQRMLARGHRLRVGGRGPASSIVGSVTGTGQPRIALDVGEDATYFDNPELPETRSEMSLPLKVGDEIIGALDVQSTEPAAYDDEDVSLLSTLADQVAVAIENALLFERSQTALNEVQELHRRYVRQEWARTLAAGGAGPGDVAYEYRLEGTPEGVKAEGAMPTDEWPVELSRALAEGRVVTSPDDDAGDAPLAPDSSSTSLATRAALAAPIRLRDQVIGAIDLEEVRKAGPGAGMQPSGLRRWTSDEVALVQAVADQVALALENARLFADTQRRAEQLAILHRVGLDITSALDLEGVLEALYEQIRRMVDVGSFYVALYEEATGLVDFALVTGIDGRIEVAPINLRGESGANSITGQVIMSGQPLYVPDLLHPPEGAAFRPISVSERSTRSYAGIPLIFREQVFGLMSVQSYEADAYTQEDIDLLNTIATQASIAIQNARAYERLVDTAEQLREVDRLKTQFLANMSHELRTPLNSIIGFSRVMLKGIDGPLTDLQEADLTSIYNSGQHLLSLINSILDMSKIEAGKMDLTFEEVHLADIFDTVMSTARALVKDRPIELCSELPDDLPAVWADSQRVRQILINLLSNAAKFTEQGKITLSARAPSLAASRDDGQDFVTITVADTGVGIDPEAQTRLFIPFQQVDASTTRRAGGTGLGLAISRSFVEMQGGTIWVESEPHQGAAFSFTLPIYQSAIVDGPAGLSPVAGDDDARAGDALDPMLAGDFGLGELDPNKKIILAIDDDRGVLTLLKRYLEHDGFQVVGVLESAEALSIARHLAADRRQVLAAITLDIVMPHLDGWEVLKALKQDPETKTIPVILCSIVDDVEQGLAMGAAACLRKPLTRNELLEVLRKVALES